MYYIDFLAGLHEQLQPPTYFEIGIRDGKSLAVSRARSIGVDPAFAVTRELRCDVSLHRTTSDDYFADPQAWKHFDGEPAALSFIDGMHLFEFALRDFVNVESGSAPHSVVVFDDVMPRHVAEAARDRRTVNWTGDVYKVWSALRDRRPDLLLIPVHTMPTGLLVVLGADPGNRSLADDLDAVITEFGADDRDVPAWVRDRAGAVDPVALLGSGLFPLVRQLREQPGKTQWPQVQAFAADLLPRIAVDWSTTPLPRPPVDRWPAPKHPASPSALARRARRRLRRLHSR